MALNILIIVVFAVSAAASVRMYQALDEAYPRLPDRMPVHFGLSGKPDRWMKKSRVTVWFMPVISLVCSLVMFATFVAAPLIIDGEMFTEFAACGAALAASLAWMMHSVNRGMIAVALGQEEKISRFVYPPLVLVIIASILPAIVPAVVSGPTTLKDMTICRAIGRHGEPEQAATEFRVSDERIYAASKWRNLNSGIIRFEWYNPAGDLYFEYESKVKSGRNMKLVRRPYSYIMVAGENASSMPGEWNVRMLYNGEVVETAAFLLE